MSFSALAGPEKGASATEAAVTDSAGVEIILNAGVGSQGHLTVEETLRLGVIEGVGPELFSQVGAVAVDEARRVFVGNGGSVSVRLFDADGVFQNEFGGRGDGPSELSMLNDLFVTGDTAVVIDWQRGGKVVLFRSDGEFLESSRIRQLDGSGIMPVHTAPGGWLVSAMPPFSPPALAPGEVWERSDQIHVAPFGSTDLGPPVYSRPITPLFGVTGGENGVDWGLFRRVWHSGFDGDARMYVTSPDAYRIDIYDAGSLVRSIRREFTPSKIGDAEVQAVKAAAVAVVDTMSRIPDARRPDQRERIVDRIDRQANLPLPAIVAPFRGILVSTDGSFWIEREDPSVIAQTEATRMFSFFNSFPLHQTNWDLFTNRGVFLGSVVLPARFRAEAVNGFEVVGVEVDELDVEYIVRYGVAGAN